MQTEAVGSSELAVVAGDVLALRGAGLAAPETWALLCQAAQALQDLFLSNGGVVGGSGVGPVVTPHTLELTPRGRVILQLASPEAARAYLPPEYRPGRVYSDTDSEKMWMYSLGRALLDTTPRIAALTGSVSVSPSSALQSVLSSMTEPDPHRRASLMNLLDVISEYCRTRLQSKPFTHIVMDMYREVMRSPQYIARKRAACSASRTLPATSQRPHQRQNRHQGQSQPQKQHQQHQKQQQPQQQGHFSKHHVKGAIFKAQSRNSRSHPNLLSLSGQDPSLSSPKPQFQSQIDIQTSNTQHLAIHHARTSSQPEYSERVKRGLTVHARSAHNLIMLSNGQSTSQSSHSNNVYSDPIYALPVKPFLSSQDVRANGLVVKPNRAREDVYGQTITGRPRSIKNGGLSQPNIAHIARASNFDKPIGQTDDGRGKSNIVRNGQTVTPQSLHRQYSNPQLPTRNLQEFGARSHSQSNGLIVAPKLRVFNGDNKVDGDQHSNGQNNPVSSMKVPGLHGPVPPKPPRVMTTLKRPAVPLPQPNNGLSESVAPAKPPRLAIKNGPRARRGKPVQRAPSRLYRALGGPTRSFNKNQCVGPEFVVRANQPPKILCVGDVKGSGSGRIVVILLTGQRIEVTCDPQKITAGELFQICAVAFYRTVKTSMLGAITAEHTPEVEVYSLVYDSTNSTQCPVRIPAGEQPRPVPTVYLNLAIVQAEGLDENFTLGLAALLAGDFAMLPPETKLNKVAPPGWLNSGKSKGTLGLPTSFMLYLRLRFFLPSLRGTRSWISKHLLYLQIRRCILEQQLVCPLAQLINLTGFALQAEFGNYNVNEHGRGDYFLLEHYIPESLILNPDLHVQQSQLPGGAEALRARLHQAHRDRRGLDANNAEEMFILHAQAMPDYGSHYYIATADNKELEKIMDRLRKSNSNRSPSATTDRGLYACTENIYQLESDGQVYGKIELNHVNSCDNVHGNVCTEEQKIRVATKAANEDIYAVPKCPSAINLVEANNNSNNAHKLSKSKKSESNVWLAIHAHGLKIFERGGRSRERNELLRLLWRDIQTLSYSKNSLVVYTRFNGKRCKFKLRMDHKKSYYAFKLTSLHHQFFLKLRSEVTSFHGLAKDFGTPLMVESVSPPLKSVPDPSKPKITIVNSVKNIANPKFPMPLEEYQNKENENPQKVVNPLQKSEDMDIGPVCYTPEEDALYAQVNARLEPEGASRDTEDESDRALASRNDHINEMLKPQRTSEEQKLYSYPKPGLENEMLHATPKPTASNDTDRTENEVKYPEELYAAINKPGHNKKANQYPVPDEVWDVDSTKSLHKVKTSSLPNYGTPRQSTGFRTPSLPRRLGVKMGTRAIYSSVVPRDSDMADDLESLSVKSDTASSIQSASAQSNDSPMPEAYVLNADIRTDDETFRIGNDDTMSASLLARLEELSFAEERILHTIQLERGHGGSIGLQVTEGNDGGVYVQAVSVGGSADMAGNVNKGDKIVAINGQSLLNLRYEEALKLLQSSSETVELVLSQITSNRNGQLQRRQEPTESNYLQNLRFEISSEVETSIMTTKWLSQRPNDVASVQNTSSAYSSAASSSMGNHNTNNMYLKDVADTNALNSASMLLSLSDFDVSLEIDAPPPVPPRRRKRKTDVIVPSKPTIAPRTIVREEKTSAVRSGASRPERKPRSLPAPPPVPGSIVPRERKLRSAGKSHSASAAIDHSRPSSLKVHSDEINLPSKPALAQVTSATNTKPRLEITDNKEQMMTAESDRDRASRDHLVNANLDCRNGNRSGRSSPIPPGNPSLFFTFRDFESVMAHSGKCDKTLSEQFHTITTPERSVPLLITSFVENSTSEDRDDDDNEEQVCFRVTTTNVPFEKCLGDGNLDYDSNDFSGQYDDTDNHYIFDDYINRRKTSVDRLAAAAARFDAAEPTGRRSATKVRFATDSPTLSSPEHISIDTSVSVAHFEPPTTDDKAFLETSVIAVEIPESFRKFDDCEGARALTTYDEFGDPPFSSLTQNDLNASRDIDSSENYRLEQASRLNEIASSDKLKNACESRQAKNFENFSRPRSTPSPRFMSPSKPQFDPIPNIDDIAITDFPPTYDPRDEGFVKKQWDAQSDPTSELTNDANEAGKKMRQTPGKLEMTSHDDRESDFPMDLEPCGEGVSKGKSRDGQQDVFIDSTFRDFLDDDADDIDWGDSSSNEDERAKLHPSQNSSHLDDLRVTETLDLRRSLDPHTYQGQEASLDKHPRHSRITARDNKKWEKDVVEEQEPRSSRLLCQDDISRLSVDINDDGHSLGVRRNSFLENMLVDNEIQRIETTVPCSIIAAHPKPAMSPSKPISLTRGHTPITTRAKSVSPSRTFRRKSDARLDKIAAGQTKVTCEKESGARPIGRQPKFAERTAWGGLPIERRKSTGEMKNDVLSELLCNFSAMKLKTVEPRERGLVLEQIDDGAEISMEMADEGSTGTTKAVERIKIENTLGIETIRGEIKIKDASVIRTASKLSQHEEIAMTKVKMANNGEIYDAERSSSLDIDVGVSAKTDEPYNRRRSDDRSAIVVIECMEDRGASRCFTTIEGTRKSGTKRDVTLENRDAIVNVDECAIVRNTSNPQYRRNNDNNNAMTPLDISNDQKSRDVEAKTIAPGSVRSFVELYEIQHEKTSEHSKSNYSLPVAKTRTRLRCFKGSWNNADYDDTDPRQNDHELTMLEATFAENREISASSIHTRGSVEAGESNEVPRMKAGRGDSEEDQFSRGNDSTHEGPSNGRVAEKKTAQESCLKINNELSPRNEARKTVTFYNDCHLAQPRDNPPSAVPFRESKIGNAEGWPKTAERRAPGRPASGSAVTEEFDCATRTIVQGDGELNPAGEKITRQDEEVNPASLPRSAVNSFASQIHRAEIEGDDKDCSIKPGIASSSPSSDVPQLRQPYVFYCRV